jgi:hypothetical protein
MYKVREIKNVMKDLQVKLSEANLQKLQKEMDHNGVRDSPHLKTGILAKGLPKSNTHAPLFHALSHSPLLMFLLLTSFLLKHELSKDGKVSVQEITTWWSKIEKEMSESLFADPTKKWGSSPATTSREVVTAAAVRLL